MRKHLIFDFDGTLLDSCSTCCHILNDMLAERGSSRMIHEKDARAFMSLGGTAMISALLSSDCGDPALELAEFRRRYSLLRTGPEFLFPHVKDGLTRLKQAGYANHICSNKPQLLIEKILQDTGIKHLFDHTVGTSPGISPKPKPDLLSILLKHIESDTKNCQFVGDSKLDQEISRLFEMDFIFVSYGYAEPDFERPKNSFDCFKDLTDKLLEEIHD